MRDEATIRAVGYYFERPDSAKTRSVLSGARALLARVGTRWPSGAACTPAVAVTTPTTPETTLTPAIHPVNPGTHYRIIGWSDDDSISTAELAAGTQFTGDVLTVPARAANGYLFIAIDESVGYPDSLLLDGNARNQLDAYAEQSQTRDRGSKTYDILVSNGELSSALSGRTITLGYGS